MGCKELPELLRLVPLSTRVVTVLRRLHTQTCHSPRLFPAEPDHQKSMTNNAIVGALERVGYAGTMTDHGFRGIAPTLLRKQG